DNMARAFAYRSADGAPAALVVDGTTVGLVDLRDPTRPELVSKAGNRGYNCELVGDTLYFLSWHGLEYAVVDPASPRLLGNLTSIPLGSVSNLPLRLAGAYLFAWISTTQAKVFDVADPHQPKLVGNVILGAPAAWTAYRPKLGGVDLVTMAPGEIRW